MQIKKKKKIQSLITALTSNINHSFIFPHLLTISSKVLKNFFIKQKDNEDQNSFAPKKKKIIHNYFKHHLTLLLNFYTYICIYIYKFN